MFLSLRLPQSSGEVYLTHLMHDTLNRRILYTLLIQNLWTGTQTGASEISSDYNSEEKGT